jgi:hypothetical protein
MSDRISDALPLLEPGTHLLSIKQVQELCVEKFSLSTKRKVIYEGFCKIVNQLRELKIPCELIVDGSFLTEEIEPDDIDFAVVVSPEFYDGCTAEQRVLIEWIRDDFSIRDTHLCDCYLCVEWPEDHELYFEGLQNRAYWIAWYSKSKLFKRDRGIAIISLMNVSETV